MICISLMTSDAVHIFMHTLAIYVFEKMSTQLLFPFLIIFMLLSSVSSLYILDINPLVNIYFQTFSPFCRLPSHFESNPRNHLPRMISKGLQPMFLCRSLQFQILSSILYNNLSCFLCMFQDRFPILSFGYGYLVCPTLFIEETIIYLLLYFWLLFFINVSILFQPSMCLLLY